MRSICELLTSRSSFTIVDQEGSPLGGVRVTFSTALLKAFPGGIAGETSEAHIRISDVNGLVGLDSIVGKHLSVERLEKNGYLTDEMELRRHFTYWGAGKEHQPDPAKPVVYHLWRSQGAEPLKFWEQSVRVGYDGTPADFNLLANEERSTAGGGDIRVTLTRTPRQVQINPLVPFHWTFRVEAPRGGLVASDGRLDYLAPEQGYQPALVWDMHPDQPGWVPKNTFHLFYRSADGQRHARVSLRVIADSSKVNSGLTITTYLNPNGSRNLEYDSAVNHRQ
jgi:hypothetical protein